ncbi:uncharacterized protein M6B38_259670 [Iris pallida]|uniref:Uncharacterized protein n=1 Tax=Iris pallida TaxID=29817 RepID=A0AAX6IE83_IRIPA|nr:uncharacterized protein M6B38_259670 [Iris pallida]
MERCRTLEVNIISAENLEQVNLLSKMNVYAHVSVSADSKDGSRHEKPKQLIRTRPTEPAAATPSGTPPSTSSCPTAPQTTSSPASPSASFSEQDAPLAATAT